MEKKIQSGVCEATWMLAQTSIALNLPCKSDVSSWISCKILSKIPLAERSPLGRSRSIFKAVISAFIFDDWAAEQHSEYHTRHFFFFFAKSFLLIFFKWVTCSDSIWRSIGRSLPRTNSWNDLDRGANSWYSILPDLDTSHLVTFTYLINLRAFPSILTSRKFYSDIQVVAISQARRVKSCCWPIQRPASGRPGPESIWMLRGCSQFECCVEQTGRHSCAATATVSTQWMSRALLVRHHRQTRSVWAGVRQNLGNELERAEVVTAVTVEHCRRANAVDSVVSSQDRRA